MNARQAKKYLKKRINRLESDNDLMRRIIEDSPTMQELYDLYNKPFNVQLATMSFQEFKAKMIIPVYMKDVDGMIEHTKLVVAKDLFECVKENITYKIDTEDHRMLITGSIFIGRKRGV